MSIKSTKRQKEILGHVSDAAIRGEWLDMDELRTLLGCRTKQATQCSVRYLEAEGFLKREYVTRRERRRAILIPTLKGFMSSKPGVGIPLSILKAFGASPGASGVV